MTVIVADPGLPAVYPLPIKQGAVLQLTVNAKDENGAVRPLTGFTARMQIRPHVESSTVLEDLSTSNGKIVITAATGKIVATIPGASTALYSWRSGVYDLFIYDSSSQPECLLGGEVDVTPAVTR